MDILAEDLARNESSDIQVQNPEYERVLKKGYKYRMKPKRTLPELKHLLQIGGIGCFPRGDLVAISGKEKCGKTTDCRIMISALLKGEYMGVKALERNVRVLWIDTEQANLSSRAVCRGIELMTGFELPDDRVFYFAFREYPDQDELTLLMCALFDRFAPDIAIIDGIRDLIPDFNDVVESSKIVHLCMDLASGVNAEKAREDGLNVRPPCCVCCILHQNKPKDDNNMRGHLGTELSNKAGEVWEATQDDDHVFYFKQIRSRSRPVDNSLTYKVNTQNYFDDTTGKFEEIGVPEFFDTNVEPTFNTKFGLYPFNTETTEMMFFTALKDKEIWEFNELKKRFLSYWGVEIPVFNKLRKLIENDFYQFTDSNNKSKWKYIGPTF